MPKSIVKRKMMENDRLHENNNKNNLKLAPETMRIRDAIIEKYSETPLDMLSSKLQALITDETDTGTKLGIFSARVEILRICLLYTSPSPRDS